MKRLPDPISHETVTCLQSLLEQAKRGEVIGAAFCAIYKRQNYHVGIVGEAKRNPTFARGVVATLDDRLSVEIHNR